MTQNYAKEPIIWEVGYKVVNVVDGDGMILKNIHTNNTIEIRMYGIDAPEIKKCRKLFEDEKKAHVPGQLLIKLGYISMKYLKELAPIGANCTIGFEKGNSTDFYNRQLAFVFTNENICLNEIMIREGFAKPLNDYYCSELHKYQKLNFAAKRAKKGLYKIIQNW
jgi:micrococcal nuclease